MLLTRTSIPIFIPTFISTCLCVRISTHLGTAACLAGNLLLTEDGALKLADFGVSSQLSSTLSRRATTIGSPYWLSPEAIQAVAYDCRTDIWSLGITVRQLLRGHLVLYQGLHATCVLMPGCPCPRFVTASRFRHLLSPWLPVWPYYCGYSGLYLAVPLIYPTHLFNRLSAPPPCTCLLSCCSPAGD